MGNTPKLKPGKNGASETTPEQSVTATMEDMVALIKANPQLQLPLTNIVQSRIITEKDAEIARLQEEQGGKKKSKNKDTPPAE